MDKEELKNVLRLAQKIKKEEGRSREESLDEAYRRTSGGKELVK